MQKRLVDLQCLLALAPEVDVNLQRSEGEDGASVLD